MIGFHLQNSPPNWLDAVAKLPADTPIKLVEGVQRAREVKATNPNLKVWFRHVADNQNVGGDLKQYARIFFNTFIDTSFLNEAKYVDWVQELNEYTGHGQSPAERAFWEDWAAAAAFVWWDEYRTRSPLSHIRLIIGEPGIGNDLGLAFAQIADTYDCLIGYHSYIPVHNGQLMPLNAKHADGSEINEWKYYSGRWTTMDDTYRQHGYYVDWLAGEGGPIRDANPWHGALDPMGGWKHTECCSGHIDCYITALRRFLDLTTAWNKEHNNRFKGMTLFTSGAPGSGPSWELFDLRQPHMDTIANFVADYMADIPTPPDPPDPPTTTTTRPATQPTDQRQLRKRLDRSQHHRPTARRLGSPASRIRSRSTRPSRQRQTRMRPPAHHPATRRRTKRRRERPHPRRRIHLQNLQPRRHLASQSRPGHTQPGQRILQRHRPHQRTLRRPSHQIRSRRYPGHPLRQRQRRQQHPDHQTKPAPMASPHSPGLHRPQQHPHQSPSSPASNGNTRRPSSSTT